MELVIDRFEGSFAVCEKENKEMINIDKLRLPQNAEEGDVIIIKDDNNIIVDKEKTAQRKKEINELAEDLWA